VADFVVVHRFAVAVEALADAVVAFVAAIAEDFAVGFVVAAVDFAAHVDRHRKVNAMENLTMQQPAVTMNNNNSTKAAARRVLARCEVDAAADAVDVEEEQDAVVVDARTRQPAVRAADRNHQLMPERKRTIIKKRMVPLLPKNSEEEQFCFDAAAS
jgi:hypothetical protein